MTYVDGFVLPVRKDKLAEYTALSSKVAPIFLELGALEYKECLLDDDRLEGTASFTDTSGAKEGETVVFAWIKYKDKAQRDETNAKIMADERMLEMCKPENHPFDLERMAWGGFDAIVDF